MTGKFIITRDHLKELGACNAGLAFFDANHPDGQGEYQTLLDEAVKGGHVDYAEWLLHEVGPTADVMEVEEINDEELEIVFAGRVAAKLGIIVKRLISGLGIEAGEGYGIYAGLRVRVSDKPFRIVRCKKKPENLMCGEFEGAL